MDKFEIAGKQRYYYMAVLNNIKLDFPDNVGKDFLKRLMGERLNLRLFIGICF